MVEKGFALFKLFGKTYDGDWGCEDVQNTT